MESSPAPRVLIPAEEITRRVSQIGRGLRADYGTKSPVLVANLQGAFIFLADLCRAMGGPLSVDFMATASYGTATKSSGAVSIVKDLKVDIEGRDVLIVEDIVDTGYTIRYLMEYMALRNPASVKVCTLLNKKDARKIEVPVDYECFTIPDRFVVGYGLDFDEKFRELPYIGEIVP